MGEIREQRHQQQRVDDAADARERSREKRECFSVRVFCFCRLHLLVVALAPDPLPSKPFTVVVVSARPSQPGPAALPQNKHPVPPFQPRARRRVGDYVRQPPRRVLRLAPVEPERHEPSAAGEPREQRAVGRSDQLRRHGHGAEGGSPRSAVVTCELAHDVWEQARTAEEACAGKGVHACRDGDAPLFFFPRFLRVKRRRMRRQEREREVSVCPFLGRALCFCGKKKGKEKKFNERKKKTIQLTAA